MNLWWAAAGAGVLYYVLGAAWFTPLFGRAWDRSIGYDRARAGGRFSFGYYLVPLVAALVSAMVIAGLIAATGASVLLVGAGLGLAVAAASVTNALTPHTPHPYLFGAITGSYHLTGCTLVGVVIGWLS